MIDIIEPPNEQIERVLRTIAAKIRRLVEPLERIGENDMGWLHYDLAKRFHHAIATLKDFERALNGGKPDDSSPVRTFLDLSTAHITERTRDMIEDDRATTHRVAAGDYGWLLFVPEEDEPDTPEDLRAIFHTAREHDCGYVMLDQDASTIEGLPIYEW